MLLSLLALTGCDLVGQSCNLMYAPDMLTVEMTRSDFDGELSLTVVGDEGTTITCVLPEEDTDASCSDFSSSVSLSGTTLTVSLWEFAPESAELTIASSLGWTETFGVTPEYLEDEPNGDGCGVRYSATESIDL